MKIKEKIINFIIDMNIKVNNVKNKKIVESSLNLDIKENDKDIRNFLKMTLYSLEEERIGKILFSPLTETQKKERISAFSILLNNLNVNNKKGTLNNHVELQTEEEKKKFILTDYKSRKELSRKIKNLMQFLFFIGFGILNITDILLPNKDSLLAITSVFIFLLLLYFTYLCYKFMFKSVKILFKNFFSYIRISRLFKKLKIKKNSDLTVENMNQILNYFINSLGMEDKKDELQHLFNNNNFNIEEVYGELKKAEFDVNINDKEDNIAEQSKIKHLKNQLKELENLIIDNKKDVLTNEDVENNHDIPVEKTKLIREKVFESMKVKDS